MTYDIKYIKDIIEGISLQHVSVKKFDFGDSWESSVDGDGIDSYPKIFMETPILGQIDRKTKQYSFGLVCFIYPSELYTKPDHFNSVTEASAILDEIITKIDKEYKQTIGITFPYSTVTFTIETTSLLDGVRADIIMTVPHSCVLVNKFDVNKAFN